jgi:AcrR family transcriptional regulator
MNDSAQSLFKPQSKPMSKRDLILDAALNLFIQQGFEKTPTSAISKAANVATGTLFHHFKTKEDLISALYLDIKLGLQDILLTSTNHQSLNDPANMTQVLIKTTFKTVWFSTISWVLENPGKFQFLTQFRDSAHINGETRERVENAFSEWKMLFEVGQKIETFNKLPVDLLLDLATNHIFTTCGFLLSNPGVWPQKEIQHELFQSFWAQLIPPAADLCEVK